MITAEGTYLAPRFVVKGHTGDVKRVGRSHYTGGCACKSWTTEYEGKGAFDVVWARHQQHKIAVLAEDGAEPTFARTAIVKTPEQLAAMPTYVAPTPEAVSALIASIEAPAPVEVVEEAPKAKWLTTLLAYAVEAGDWSGAPWVSQSNLGPATPAVRSHLRTAVKKGLIVISTDDSDAYITFTAEGVALCRENGVAMEWAGEVAAA